MLDRLDCSFILLGLVVFRLSLLIFLLSCTTSQEASQQVQPDIILLLSNGLRADGTDALLSGLALSPDWRFSSAYSQSPVPFTSLGSVLTGRYPSAIPMCGVPYRHVADIEAMPWCAGIPSERHTLPSVLALYGYTTALLTDTTLLRDHLGSTFSEQLADDEVAEWWAGVTGPRLLVVSDSTLMLKTDATLRQASSDAIQARFQEASETLGQRWGSLLSTLPTNNRRLVVAGLHGQNLKESGGGGSLPKNPLFNDIILERTVHVSLLVFGEPTPRTITPPVELLDILPTALVWAGAAPLAGLPGTDLHSEADPSGHAYAELGDMLMVRQGAEMLSLRAMLHHITALDPQLDQALQHPTGHLHLHNVESDPLQTADLVREDLDRREELLLSLRAIRAGDAAPPPKAMTDEHLQAIRMTASEGYW
ncbi:MAG: arylsulfatase A-like enzyme [Myxococcota bacterium]|jgi:arylsulfatase A-like enzyme